MLSEGVARRCASALPGAVWILCILTTAHADRGYRVDIDTRPTGAEIFLDDSESEPLGTTPLTNARLAPGVYTLVVKKDGFEVEYEQIKVKRGRNRFVIELERVELSYLEIVPHADVADDLAGARVLIDGEDRGELPLEVNDVAAGSHVIEVTKPGFTTFEEWVEVDRGSREKIVVRLARVAASGGDSAREANAPKTRRTANVSRRPSKPVVEHASGSPIAVVGVGFEFGARYFRYENLMSTEQRDYDAFGVPRFRLLAELYPLVPLEMPALDRLGIVAGFGKAFGLTSVTGTGEGVATGWTDFDVGLRYQYPVGPLLVGGAVAYGRQAYTFDENNPLFDAIPEVDYRFVRIGLDGSARLHRYVSVQLGGSYLVVSSIGAVGDRFTNAEAQGVGARVGLVGHIVGGLELRIEAIGSRFEQSYDMGGTASADGSTDLLGTVFVGGVDSD
jgi:hypothetical protein